MEIRNYQKRTWAEIDLDAIEHNFRVLSERTDSNARTCCVIKANGYGHGAVQLAKLYEELGAHFFAVSNVEEAIQLRRRGITRPILNLGYVDSACARELARYDVSQCVYSYEVAKALSDNAIEGGVRVKIHVKIDTGMGRIGYICRGNVCEESASLDAIEATCALPSLEAEGVFMHFAVADEGEAGEEYTRAQYECFCKALSELEKRNIKFKIRHASNSAAILEYPDMHLDMVRAGIALYGLVPSFDIRRKADLRPAMTLKSVVSYVKTLHAGESVGYGRTYVAERDMRIATVSAGYADGVRRSNSNGVSYVLLKGKRAYIVGRVAMDQFMIDVSDIDDVRVGDEVTIFGASPAMSADEMAAANSTIGYEIVCGVAMRVPRVYIRGGRIVEIDDRLI